MSRSTIETKHRQYLNELKGNADAELEYLLNAVEFLEQHELCTERSISPNHEKKTMNGFVVVESNQRKGQNYDNFVAKIENAPSVQIVETGVYYCDTCNLPKVKATNESSMICPVCGHSTVFFDTTSDNLSYDQEITAETNVSFAYKRINHFNEWLAQFQAKESMDIPQDIINTLLAEFKKERITSTNDITQTKVRTYLKKLKLNKYYEHVPHITNLLNGKKPPSMSPEIEEKLRNMFRDIQEPFERNKPKHRSNFLSYSYCLYKFCELLGYNEYLHCFPLLKSREKLYQQDCIWKGICKDLGYQYISTI